MKWIVVLITIVILNWFYFYLKEIPITVLYNYTGNQPLIIEQALNYWNLSGIYFKSSPNGILRISHNCFSDFTDPAWGGEYKSSSILLNTRYNLSKKDLKGLVAHEAGHFIGLPHNDRTNSLMNHYSPYDTPISSYDIESAKKLKWFLWLKLLYYRLTVAP